MPLSDSSETCIRAVRPKPSPVGPSADGRPRGLPVLVQKVSRRVWGLRLRRTAQGLALTTLNHVAFRRTDGVGVLIAHFRSSIPSPPIPLFTLHCAPRGTQSKTRGRVDRYSFLVRNFHSLLPAGLSRRTGPLFSITFPGRSFIFEVTEFFLPLSQATSCPGLTRVPKGLSTPFPLRWAGQQAPPRTDPANSPFTTHHLLFPAPRIPAF